MATSSEKALPVDAFHSTGPSIDMNTDAAAVARAVAEAAEAAQSVKRPRSPGTGAATDEADESPKKIARLANGSRFGETAEETPLLSSPKPEDLPQLQGQEDAAMALLQADGANEQAAQTALSVLRGAEALLSQRAASEAATDAVADAEAATTVATTTAQQEAEDISTGVTADVPTDAASDTTTNINSDAAAAAAAAAALAEAAADQLAAANVATAAAAAAAAAAAVSNNGIPMENGQMDLDSPEDRTGALYPASIGATPTSLVDTQPMHPPMPIPDLAPKSPSAKRHKCPYCDTEFTRHHNLKSHLLTHSQEKPYVCTGCDMRFRRLHDLKRHSKLHTGEKPHICPRCDRKFARGDALARHSKGAGGCAGRRSSSNANTSAVGDESFEGNSSITDADVSVMSGIVYDSDERISVSKADYRGAREAFDVHGRAYPPLPEDQRAATAASGLFPPNVDRTAAGTSAAGTASAVPGHTGSTSALFSQHGIAESPKALSLAVGHDAASAQFTQRRADLAAGLSDTASLQLIRPSNGATSNGDTNANIFSSEQGMWTYIQTLEEKLKANDEKLRQQDERIALLEAAKLGYEVQISNLTKEIGVLRGHTDAVPVPAQAEEAQEAPLEEPLEEPLEQPVEQPVEEQLEQQLGAQLESAVEQQQ